MDNSNELNCSSIEAFTKNGFSLILEGTKCTNALPSGASKKLYTAHNAFTNVINYNSNKILDIIDTIIKSKNIKGNIQRRDNDEKFDLLQETNDLMLEQINSNLDELSGERNNSITTLIQTEIETPNEPIRKTNESWNLKIQSQSPYKKLARLLSATNIVRPQINFKIPVDNRNLVPFEPRIKYKPNSIKPLAVSPEYAEDGTIESYLHPYEFELNKFQPNESQLTIHTPQTPLPLDGTPLVHIHTEQQLTELIEELSNVKEIAVDLEHHSYRTFQGFTCLLQISTRSKDYIIDALTLRDELHVLNEIFTNPLIVKVFHGADSDIEWLQRDLSLYIVNLFDTHQAAKRLNLARLSLAYLIKSYCHLDIDKTYQLADWRIRPLPDELILYARQDTHYLLYIYDILTNELLKDGNEKTNLLENVYHLSTEICKKRYIKPMLLTDSYMDLYRKSKRNFDNKQLYGLKELYFWRDKIARQADESYGYVLPNHMLLQIAETLPREMQGILACCNPIPPMVRQQLHVLHQFILKAREQPLIKPIIAEDLTTRMVQVTKSRNLSSHLYCPHDLSINYEFRDDLPTLLGTNDFIEDFNSTLKVINDSSLGICKDMSKNLTDIKKKQIINRIEVKFISPYSRYLAVLPFVHQQRIEELTKQQEEDKKKKLCPDNIPEENSITKQEVNRNDNNNSLPLKDYGKRKHIENKKLTIPTVTEASTPTIVDLTEPVVKRPCLNKNSNRNDKHSSSSITENKSEFDNAIEITDDDSGSVEIISNDSDENVKVEKNKKLTRKKRNKNNRFGRVDNKTGQSSNKPISFDYSTIDYNKYKGGSQQLQKGNEFRTKFHGKSKGNKGDNKKFNRLFTFSNDPNKKKFK